MRKIHIWTFFPHTLKRFFQKCTILYPNLIHPTDQMRLDSSAFFGCCCCLYSLHLLPSLLLGDPGPHLWVGSGGEVAGVARGCEGLHEEGGRGSVSSLRLHISIHLRWECPWLSVLLKGAWAASDTARRGSEMRSGGGRCGGVPLYVRWWIFQSWWPSKPLENHSPGQSVRSPSLSSRREITVAAFPWWFFTK